MAKMSVKGGLKIKRNWQWGRFSTRSGLSTMISGAQIPAPPLPNELYKNKKEKYGLWIICGINWSIKRKAPLKDETLRSAFPYKYNFMIANPKIMSRGNYKYIRGDFIKNIYKIIIKKSNLYD